MSLLATRSADHFEMLIIREVTLVVTVEFLHSGYGLTKLMRATFCCAEILGVAFI